MVATIVLLALAVAVTTSTTGPLLWRVGALRLRSGDPLRAATFAFIGSLLLFGMTWRASRWRPVTGTLLTFSLLLTLVFIVRNPAPQWPVGDMAILEIYTQHASKGRQLLGPYSQFGWFHPGPMLFYWFAPFYVLGQHSSNVLGVAAFGMNLLSLVAVAIVGIRHGRAAPALSITLWLLLALFFVRMPGLFTSIWNPHVPVMPLVGLLFVGAAVACGDAALLPPLVLLASFIIQSHIGFVPTAGFIAGCGVAGFALNTWRGSVGRIPAAAWTALAIVLLELVWLLPVAEQLTSPLGNMTRIWRFFFDDPGTPQSLGTAWMVWSTALMGVFRPGLTLPLGHALPPPRADWVVYAGTALAAALGLAAAAFGSRHRYERSLALICLGALAVGFWSVLRVRGAIGDYHVFWLAAVGLVAGALVLAVPLTVGVGTLPPDASRLIAASMPALVIMLVVGAVSAQFVRSAPAEEPGPEPRAVRRIVTGLRDGVPTLGRKPLIRLDPAVWGVGAGVVLQFVKAGDRFGVDELAGLFGAPVAADGSEDVLVVICGAERHAELTRDPRVRTLAADETTFADAVSLDDAPEYGRR
jgi:hypothetical protein